MLKFTKMHGIGNDYIYINGFEQPVDDPACLSVKLSDRHFSIGGDGIVLILPSAYADFRMRMFNADGSEGKMCGNATRCIGKYVYEKGMTDKTDLTLETLSGIKKLHLGLAQDGTVSSVRVGMGKAEFAAEKIPVDAGKDAEVIGKEFSCAGKDWRISCVSVGNPHCVVPTEEDIRGMDLDRIGPCFEHHAMFPERVNTEFVNFISPTELSMRVWERGSGETMACGTGACAVVCAAVKLGICRPDAWVTVHLRGGDLKILVTKDWQIEMEGPAAFSFEGEVSV